ncbi:MAG: guanylate kinase [Candidatus Cloacimonetes bacterium]|nr:guanylate kinase [Candidatus Cloacimonadota bacterium]
MRKKGFLVTIASPSGGGKSTICKEILSINPLFCYSISWTTRNIRGNEIDGKDYFFTDIETFNKKLKAGFFIEYAEVHGNYYGTSKDYLENCLNEEKIVLLDIDVQGVESIKKQGFDVVSIFILPPNENVLKKRLLDRGTDSIEVINKRLENSKKEINYLQSYDYLVINEDFLKAVETVNDILVAEMNRLNRYVDPLNYYYINSNNSQSEIDTTNL